MHTSWLLSLMIEPTEPVLTCVLLYAHEKFQSTNPPWFRDWSWYNSNIPHSLTTIIFDPTIFRCVIPDSISFIHIAWKVQFKLQNFCKILVCIGFFIIIFYRSVINILNSKHDLKNKFEKSTKMLFYNQPNRIWLN